MKGNTVLKEPQGQMRPADVIGSAVLIAKMVTGEAQGTSYKQSAKVKSGKVGAKARSDGLSSARKLEISKEATSAR
jgi:hypothetical protein